MGNIYSKLMPAHNYADKMHSLAIDMMHSLYEGCKNYDLETGYREVLGLLDALEYNMAKMQDEINNLRYMLGEYSSENDIKKSGCVGAQNRTRDKI